MLSEPPVKVTTISDPVACEEEVNPTPMVIFK
jgi:hypothetical protein